MKRKKEMENQIIEHLITLATEAFQKAYAPYSHYAVGAAVLGNDGQFYSGCNVENAVYPLTICAERVAITKAISEGATQVKAIAVVTANSGMPCGSCRQVMREFGDDDLPIYISGLDGHYTYFTLGQLLPYGFSAGDLMP